MRIITAIIFTLSYIGTSLSYGGQQCSIMFGAEQQPVVIAGLLPAPKPKAIIEITQVKSESNRVELKKYTGSEEPEKVTIEEMKFSEKPEEAMRELLNMVIKNSAYALDEKNVLTKGELVLGIPAIDGKYFEVKYKSVSTDRPQFVVEKITLRTPTGSGDKKIAETFLKSGQLKIKKADHEIGDALGAGINAKIKIPLVIDGPLLAKFDSYSGFFKYFKKEELRDLFASKSMLKIRTVLEFRRARSVFLKVLVKEPFKAAIGYGFVAITAAALSLNTIGGKTEAPHSVPPARQEVVYSEVARNPREVTGFLSEYINRQEIPQVQQIRSEITELNKQINTKFANKEAQYSGPSLADLRLENTAFSQHYNTWIIEKADAYNNSTHTYIVFAEAKTSAVGPGLQYVVLEISASKYPELIKFIKQQQSIPTAQQAQAR